MVQLNTPDYDPDIDGQPDPVIDLQLPNAESIKKDTTPNTSNPEQHPALSTDTNRPQPQPSSASDDSQWPGYQDNTHSRSEHPVITAPNWKTSQNWRQMKRIGKKANLQTLTSLIITTPLRKVTEYVTSTLHILRKLQNRTTVPTMIQHQGSNIRFLNQNITTPTPVQNNTEVSKSECISPSPTIYGRFKNIVWPWMQKSQASRNQPSDRDRQARQELQEKTSDFQVTFDDNVYLSLGPEAKHDIYNTFNPDKPSNIHLDLPSTEWPPLV